MLIAWYIALAFTMAVVAFGAAMIGIGGGVLYTPLQLLFGINIHEAATTSLFLIVVLCVAATCIYHRAGKVDWPLAIVLEIFTVTGGFAGGYLSEYLSETILIVVLIAVVVFGGFTMLTQKGEIKPHAAGNNQWYLWKRSFDGEEYTVNIMMAFPVVLLAGAISGMVGVGGGIIKVPLMVLLLGVPVDIAIATSALMVGITAAGGFAGHLVAGHWNWTMSLILAPGIFIGAQLGARCMLRLDKERLKKIFGVIMLLIGTALIIKSL